MLESCSGKYKMLNIKCSGSFMHTNPWISCRVLCFQNGENEKELFIFVEQRILPYMRMDLDTMLRSSITLKIKIGGKEIVPHIDSFQILY